MLLYPEHLEAIWTGQILYRLGAHILKACQDRPVDLFLFLGLFMYKISFARLSFLFGHLWLGTPGCGHGSL